MANNIMRIRELIAQINKADEDYYMKDAPTMSDKEYDALVEELQHLEITTGVVFANSPSRKVGGKNSKAFKEVEHVKPMLSAKKTKDKDKFYDFALANDIMLSWKMDGLTLVLKYENGELVQALTRGEEGLMGEEITHTVKHLRSVPLNIPCKETLYVRGEGVLSYKDHKQLTRNEEGGHPRNLAAGMVRTMVPDKGRLSHMDFFAFELIKEKDRSTTKEKQLIFLMSQGFKVVEHKRFKCNEGREEFDKVLESFEPKSYPYPVDGIIAEYNDLAYGKSLGATEHHENRMMALKWEDKEVETTFRRVTMANTRNGLITLAVEFDPVEIDGTKVKRADLHSLSQFYKLQLGEGDRIKVYKANQIVPQLADNLTRSGTYQLPKVCPCCSATLEKRNSSHGSMNLFCPNEKCLSRNALKLARFCDDKAMQISELSDSMVEKMMEKGMIHSLKDIYHLKDKAYLVDHIEGLSMKTFERILEEVEKSRECKLGRFLYGMGIPTLTRKNCDQIENYFEGSFEKFEKALMEHFAFTRIEGISEGCEKKIYSWYESEEEGAYYRPVLEELSFENQKRKTGTKGNAFANAEVAVTGTINGMNAHTAGEVLKSLGASVTEKPSASTNYIIVGDDPNPTMLGLAIATNVKILSATQFSRMLTETEV